MHSCQPRSQGFSLLNWVADPIQKGKALGTRLHSCARAILGDPGADSRVGTRIHGQNSACAEVSKTHVSAPGLLHLLRQFQKMTENFEITACDGPEKCFFWPISGEHLPGAFVSSYTEWFSLSVSLLVLFVPTGRSKFILSLRHFFI